MHKQDLPWMQKDAVILIACDYAPAPRLSSEQFIAAVTFSLGLYDNIASLKIGLDCFVMEWIELF